MNKFLKTIGIIILVLVILCVSFIAGIIANESYDFNIASLLGFPSKPHTVEALPDSEPHTAEEVIDVQTVVPFDDEGNGTIEIEQQKVPYVVEVDFYPVLLDKAELEKKLIIMSQKATASETAEKAGLFSFSAFKQTKAIIFHGEGTYYVDLSSMSKDNFIIDNEQRTITIIIPKPQLSVSLLPDETEFFDSSNGSLRFGEMQITPEAMTTLQSKGIARIKETLESDKSTWEIAQKFAKLSIKEIYQPLVTAQVDAAVQNAQDEFAIPAYYTIVVEIKD